MRTAQLSKKKYNSIDVAKFVCAILVVAIHVSPFGDTDSILRYVNFGISIYIRVLSSLVFYTHLWVAFIFSKLVNVLNENLNKTCLKFICISAISLAISYIIYKLSLNDKYKFLQKLYN